MIIFDNITINYPKETVFKDFSIRIAKREKIVLSGPSGSGKSTFLNAIMGFVTPVSGKILVNGEMINAQTVHNVRKHIAWLPQELSFDIKSNRDLVYFPFAYSLNRQTKPSETEINATLQALLLSPDILQKNTDEISGGQKQRILLASMLLLKKDILLLDEPTSALDATSVKALLALVFKQKNLTVISTSHDKLWIENMDRIINLKSLQI